MRIDGLIFDNDGTLVDSEGVAAQVLSELLQQRGIDLSSESILEHSRGVRFAAFVAKLGDAYPALGTEAFVAEYRERSQARFRERTEAMPGARAFLEQSTLPRCVASNGPREKIETTLQSAGLLALFKDRIVSAYEVESWKPDPGLIHEAVRLLGLEARHCLLVEDSVAGVMAGLAAGTHVAGYGEVDLSRFDGEPGFHRVRDYAALAELIKRHAA